MKPCSHSFDDIVNFYEGRSDAATEATLRRHLHDGCPQCQERLAWARQFLPALHDAVQEASLSAPETALARARQIARDRRPAPAPRLRERVAQLLFDSRRSLAAAPVRGGAEPEAQQLYATETHYIEIWSEATQDGKRYLIGQAVTRDAKIPVRPRSATLVANDGRQIPASMEAAEFHLAFVEAGAYELRIHLEDEMIVLPEMQVGTFPAAG